MVTQVTSFSRSGLSDWLIQRVAGVILLAYFICVGGILLSGVDYASWKATYATTGMRIFTLLAALSFAAHAWIGLWAVFTDYLTERLLGPNGNWLRRLCEIGSVLVLMIYLLWVIQVIWG